MDDTESVVVPEVDAELLSTTFSGTFGFGGRPFGLGGGLVRAGGGFLTGSSSLSEELSTDDTLFFFESLDVPSDVFFALRFFCAATAFVGADFDIACN